MGNSNTESDLQTTLISLQAQRIALVAAAEMHVRRSEELSYQIELITTEIEDLKLQVQP